MSSLIGGSHIYTGVWVDWSKGAALGSTVTLSSRTGAALTAFLAFFVTIIGACLWRIVCFIIHQLSATVEAKDGVHHQHQLIFRNTSSPSSAARAFAESAFSWRKNSKGAWSRSLPLAAFAIVFMLGFGAASLLTSLVTKAAGSSRLVVSDNCGWFASDSNGTASQNAYEMKDLQDTYTASQYARTCYNGGNGSNSLQCNLFVKPALAYTTKDVECPFEDNICNGTAFQVDTGRLNSHADFGINMPKMGRLEFRKVTTCAPLQQDDYVSVTTSDGTGVGAKGDRIRHYSYGGWMDISGMANDTYIYNQHAFVDNFGYQFEATMHRAHETMDAWIPIPALTLDNADTTIMFLAPNAIEFLAQNDDPFFHANFGIPKEYIVDVPYWFSDNWVNVMACTDQYQWCNPLRAPHDTQACSKLTGYYEALETISNDTTSLGLNDLQSTTGSLMMMHLRPQTVYHAIGNRGASALRAQETVNNRAQSPIPDTQWQTEVQGWFETSLSRLQRDIMSYAAGPEHVIPGSHVQPPTGPVTRSMCFAQKVNVAHDTVSFSILGVAIILAVGALIILVYLVLEFAVGWIQRRYDWGDYRRVRWIMDDKLQVQRMAFEGHGMGDWTGLSSNVPVTAKGQVFGGLKHVDPENPRLRREVGLYGGGEEGMMKRVVDRDDVVVDEGNEYPSMTAKATATATYMPRNNFVERFDDDRDDQNSITRQSQSPPLAHAHRPTSISIPSYPDTEHKTKDPVVYSKPVYKPLTPPLFPYSSIEK